MEFISVLTNVVTWLIIALTAFIGPKWISEKVVSSTRHEYNELLETIKLSNAKVLEKEKESREIRLKSALIAELLAEWISQPDDMAHLRKLTFEAFIWLPVPLAEDLSKILAHEKSAKDYKEFIIDVRKHLLGNADNLSSDSIVVFNLSQSEQTRVRISNPL